MCRMTGICVLSSVLNPQIAKTLGSTSIPQFRMDRYLIDIDARAFAIWIK